jgi:hypothetical protein
MEQEQEKCHWCKAGKFDPPKRKCSEPNFHWLLAGREWHMDGENKWVAVETKEHRQASFDGLLNRGDMKAEAAAISNVQIGTLSFEAQLVDGKLTLVKQKEE